MKRTSRLNFTAEEQAAPHEGKPVRKAKKADKAQTKKPEKQYTQDTDTGTVRTRLRFSERKLPSGLTHAVKTVPAHVGSVSVRQQQDDNAALDAVQATERGAAYGTRLAESASRVRQLRLHRNGTERRTEQSQPEQPGSNPASRWQQRQAIRRQYAAAKAGRSKQTEEVTARAAEAARAAAEKTGAFVRRHGKGFVIFGVLGLLLAFLLSVFSSCAVLLQGAGSVLAGSSYPSEDADMRGAERAYRAMETELEAYLYSYEDSHDYDEYHYALDSVGHDPYVLISILTAWKGGAWTLEDVTDTLETLFDLQYRLQIEVTTETRDRTETFIDDAGDETETETPYSYSICSITLENADLSHLPATVLDEDQLALYAAYMGTLGNRDDLFPDSPYVARYSSGYGDYDIPEALLDDARFAAIITEAEKYLGYPYVWGGSSPATSFDCSGYVSWVLNHSGWSVGRLTTDGLYALCTPIPSVYARPGDLVFFRGTYDTPGISHVGIYVGNDVMLHCGDPISYTHLSASYWQQHFAGYGHLP